MSGGFLAGFLVAIQQYQPHTRTLILTANPPESLDGWKTFSFPFGAFRPIFIHFQGHRSLNAVNASAGRPEDAETFQDMLTNSTMNVGTPGANGEDVL